MKNKSVKQSNDVFTEYIFETKEQPATGNFERKITVLRKRAGPDHDKLHDKETQDLVDMLGIPQRDDGKIKIEIIGTVVHAPIKTPEVLPPQPSHEEFNPGAQFDPHKKTIIPGTRQSN